MAKVSWIKIATDIWTNRKIKMIERQPQGDSLIIIWFKLITLAGEINDGGAIYFDEDIPYNSASLSIQLDRSQDLIEEAIKIFTKYKMIEIEEGFIYIKNWEKYQNAIALEELKEKQREYNRKYYLRRKKEKLEKQNKKGIQENSTLNQESSRLKKNEKSLFKDTDTDIDIDKDKDIDRNPKRSTNECIALIIKKWNKLDNNIANITCITQGTERYRNTRARINEYGLDTVLDTIDLVNQSRYLKGYIKDWRIDYDWFIKPSNFIKVKDNKYTDFDKSELINEKDTINAEDKKIIKKNEDKLKKLVKKMEYKNGQR